MPHVLSNTTSKRRRLLTLLLSLVVALAGMVLAPASYADLPSQLAPSSPIPINSGVTLQFSDYDVVQANYYEASVTADPNVRNWKRLSSSRTDTGFTANVTGLQNKTPYTVYLRGVNSDGAGPEVQAGTAPVTPGLPLAPYAPGVAGNRSVTISIITPVAPENDGGFDITGYEVSVTTDASARAWRPATGIDASGSGSTVVGGLDNGSTYYVAVRARNSLGAGDEFVGSPVVPGLPKDFYPSGVPTDQGAIITFTVPDDGGVPITRYDFSADTDQSVRHWVNAGCFPNSAGCTIGEDGTATINVTGLSNGSLYYVFVRAHNATGDKDTTSSDVQVTPDRAPDGPPTDVVATASESSAPSVEKSGTAIITFTPPVGGGGVNPTDSNAFPVASTDGSINTTCYAGAPCEVTGLDNGASYAFTVAGINNAGQGPFSEASNVVVPAGAPYAPRSIARVEADPKSATVSFVPPIFSGAGVLRYQVSSDNGKTWRNVTTRVSGSRRLAVATGLRSGTRYALRVRAVNVLGTGVYSASVIVLTGPGVVPGRPAARAGTSAALVRWPASAGRDVVGYTVVSTSGARCYTQTRTENSCIIGNKAGVRTYYRVFARNATGISYASAATNTVRASWPSLPSSLPGVPGGFRAVSKKVKSGKKATLIARGFLPNSSVVLVAYGKQRHVVKRFTSNAAGNFKAVVTMPKDSARSLTFVAFGVTPYASAKSIAASIRRG